MLFSNGMLFSCYENGLLIFFNMIAIFQEIMDTAYVKNFGFNVVSGTAADRPYMHASHAEFLTIMSKKCHQRH